MDVIQIENISKQYRLGVVGTNTLRGDVGRWWAKITGKEDPALKIGVENILNEVSGKYVWALKDIDLNVEKGDILGIIGKNGAGKTTLLKLLTRITAPSTGQIKIKGKIASLLEVGTGFHPELTGRENIFLNGAILGMKRTEIKGKFDEIVDFSGVGKYIDTPVKRYSSGMYVRLAFAVAAHLDSDILVIDEVLAVGDAEFQEKCLGKMKDIVKQGRTILFVSHNMASVKSICSKGILMHNGEIIDKGVIHHITDKYINMFRQKESDDTIPENASLYYTGEAKLRSVHIVDENNKKIKKIYYRQKFIINVRFEVYKIINDGFISVGISTKDGVSVIYLESHDYTGYPLKLDKGISEIGVEMPVTLLPGEYYVWLSLSHMNGKTIDWVENVYDFSVMTITKNSKDHYLWDKSHGVLKFDTNWIIDDSLINKDYKDGN